MVESFKLVFSDFRYVAIACAIFVGLLISLSIASAYVFLEPYVIGHIPQGTEFGFSLIVIVSALSGIVVSMNLYRIKMFQLSKRKLSGGVFGSFIGVAAGACSCGPLGFALISTFGAAGGIATSFVTNFEIPIRLAAIAVLGLVYFTTVKSLKVECNIKK